MRVYFGVCGIGLGHAGRCIPIARRLEGMGAETIFSTYRDAIGYISQECLRLVEAPPIGFVVKPDGSLDFRQTTANPGPFYGIYTFLKQLTAEIRFMKSFKPDVVVSDSRASSIVAAKFLGIPRVTLLNQYQIIIPRRRRFLRLARIGDAGFLAIIGRIWVMGEYLLIPDFPKPYTISIGNLRIPSMRMGKVRLVGPILPLRPEDLPSQRDLRKQLGFDGNPLIFAPVSGPLETKEFLVNLLQKIFERFPNHYQFVMSLGNPNASDRPIKKGNLTIYPWIRNRFEFLKACDLVISRPGHGTLMQSICYGKPMILIPTPNQTEQIGNAKRAAELGFAKVIEQEDLGYNSLLASVQEILEEDYRRRVEQIQKKALEFNAIETIANVVMRVVVDRS